MTDDPLPPSPQELAEQIKRLELQSGTILYISGVNLIMNALMIIGAFLVGAR